MKKINLIIPILASLISLVSADVGDNDFGSCFGGMMYGSYGLGMGLFGWIFGLLIIVTLVLFIVWLLKQIQKK